MFNKNDCSSISKGDTFTEKNGIVALSHLATRKGNKVSIITNLFAENTTGVKAFCKRFGISANNESKVKEIIILYNRQKKTDDKNGTVITTVFDGLDKIERQEAIDLKKRLKNLTAKSKANR